MKIRNFTLLLFVLILSSNLFAQKMYAEFTFNQFANKKYYPNLKGSISYSASSEDVYLTVDARNAEKFVILDSDDREEFRNLLLKSLAWNEKAKKQKAVFKKDVGEMSLEGGFKYGNKYHFDNSVDITLKFKGYIGEKTGKYYTDIFLVVSKMQARDNQFIDVEHHIIFMTPQGVRELIEGLGDKKIVDFLAKEKQQKNVADEFK